MAETQNTINITSLLKTNLKTFKDKVLNIDIETKKSIQLLLQDAKSSREKTRTFYKEYGNTTGIDQRLIVISAAILKNVGDVKANVESTLKRRS